MAGPDASAIDWSHVRGALVGASIHAGKHQKAAERFVRNHAADLTRVPSAFFSVSLAAASKNVSEVEAAANLAKAFPAACGWRPEKIESMAGRLAYLEYGFFIRWLMKRIARKEGAPTDTSRDYELTDWEMVDKLAREMARRIHAPAAVA
jgi:menaquinone-dependent protoporphyrinogen oxidase